VWAEVWIEVWVDVWVSVGLGIDGVWAEVWVDVWVGVGLGVDGVWAEVRVDATAGLGGRMFPSATAIAEPLTRKATAVVVATNAANLRDMMLLAKSG
jgi:hypothetical protein